MPSIHTSATVGPDGTLDLHIPNLPPGQRVAVTIDVADDSQGSPSNGGPPAHRPSLLTALDLMQPPLEEHHRLLAQSVPEAAEALHRPGADGVLRTRQRRLGGWR